VWAYEKEAFFFIKGVIGETADRETGATAYVSG